MHHPFILAEDPYVMPSIDHENIFGWSFKEYQQILEYGVTEALKAAEDAVPSHPNSNCKYGAFIITDHDETVSGCNTQFDSHHDIHAEVDAIRKGKKLKKILRPTEQSPGRYIKAIFIATLEKEEADKARPCGNCRQAIYSYALNPNTLIVCAGSKGIDFSKKEDWNIEIHQQRTLFPSPFRRDKIDASIALKTRHDEMLLGFRRNGDKIFFPPHSDHLSALNPHHRYEMRGQWVEGYNKTKEILR